MCGWGLFLIYIWLALLLFLIGDSLLATQRGFFGVDGLDAAYRGLAPPSVFILIKFTKTLVCGTKNAPCEYIKNFLEEQE